MATDGNEWFIYSETRGMSRGSKNNNDKGNWSCSHQHDDKSLREITMTFHKD